MTKKKIFSRVGAGLIAIALLVTTYLSLVPTFEAEADTTYSNYGWLSQLSGFPSKDDLLTQACKLLGKPYGTTVGQKGGDPWHDQDGNEVVPYGVGKPSSIQTADKVQAVDCSGLVWWTLTSLGYQTTGFHYNYSVPANTEDWLITQDNITISCNGYEAKGKASEAFARFDTDVINKSYWLTEDGETIPGGTIVIADKLGDGAINHAWIYMGEFESRDAVIKYITNNCGVSPATAAAYVEDGKGEGGTHWRIESTGSKGVTINNRVDAKGASGYKIAAISVIQDKGSLTITKYIDPAGVGGSAYVASQANYPDYSEISFTLKNAEGKYVAAQKLGEGNYEATETYSDTEYKFYLSKNGKITVTNLNEGEYTIDETTDFDALGLKITDSVKATIKGGENTPISITNYELEGSIEVIKKSRNVHGVEDQTLAAEVRQNARFTIYDDTAKKYVNAGHSVVGEYHYSSYSATPVEYRLGTSGKLKLTNLPADHKYTVMETQTGANYSITKAAEVVALTTDNPDQSVTFYNDRKSGNLTVLKYGKTIDGDTYEARIDSPYPGMAALNEAVEFKLITYTGSYVTARGSDGTYEYYGGTSNEDEATIFTLDDRGIFTLTGLPTSPDKDSRYILKEIKTAKGYTLAEDQEIFLESNTAIPIDNYEQGIIMTINKEFILAQIGDEEASDAMYEKCTFVVKDSVGNYLLLNLTDADTGAYTYASKVGNKDDATALSLGDVSHQAVISGLPLDKYTIEEIVDTSIFTPTETEITVDGTSGDNVEATFENTELYGGFSIYKKTASMHNVSGIQFRIYGTSYGGREIDVRTSETDASGFISVNSIPYGEYTIEECGDTVLGCFSVADGQTIVINKPLSEFRPELSFMNELYSGVIKINKATETGNPLQGFEFTIYAEEDIYEGLEIEENLLYKKGEAIEVLVTDVNGNAESTYILPYNYKYTIKETKAIKPYNCDAAPQTFVLERTEDNTSEYYLYASVADVDVTREPNTNYNVIVTNKMVVDDKEYAAGDIYTSFTTDRAGNATITLPAIPEADFEIVVVDATEEATQKDLISGPDAVLSTEPITVLNFVDSQQECELTIYKVDDKNEEVKLTGAEFDIIAMEDIYVNGELTYKTGDTITHVITDENGEAKATLPAGYMVGLKETKAPEGYNLAQDVTSVDLNYDVKLLYTEQSISVKNGYQKGKLSVYKIDSTNTKKLLEGAEFDVIAKEDITVSGDEHKAGDVIAHIVTDKNGVASVDLWSGYTYLLKETKAPEGYELSDSVTEITIDYNPDILYSETSVSVKNKPKSDVPKTGTSLPIAPVVGAGVLAAAAIGTAIVIKKKED